MSFLKLKLSFSGHFTLESRVNSMGILVIWYYEISNIEREREGVKVEKVTLLIWNIASVCTKIYFFFSFSTLTQMFFFLI